MAYQPPAAIQTALDTGRISEDAVDLFRAFARRYPFPLDDFQVEAIRAILEGSSVIVSAPTGAGKTLVAEFAIHDALMAKRRVAYTTPLKALSNQKYADFCRQFGVAEVGILTGDVKVNARAPVLVMTTEILRNMFYTGTLEGLRHVVLDECHYMGDEGRGTVWEEIIVNAPKDVTLVALSATVANVREIADWIGLVHRPIHAVIHPHRPVPLRYHMADLAAEVHSLDAVRTGRAKLVGVAGGGDEARGRFYGRRAASVTALIEELEARGWLPAIYFIFSRAGCERAMDEVLEEGRTLLDRARVREVDQAIADAIDESPTLAASALNQTIFQALRAGVGLHHAGILPSLKRLTEVLFERGLVRVVFATETMSLGIHMPARSVVLQGLTKRTDRGFRALTTNELTQMAGRAGRRGIDPEGQCVIALDARDSLEEALSVVDGAPEPITSQFRLGFGSVALLVETVRDEAAIRRVVESSFGQYQSLRHIRHLEREVSRAQAALAEAERYEAPCGEFDRIGRYRQLRAEVEARRRARGSRSRPARAKALDDVEPGRVMLLRQRGSGGGLGVVVGVHRLRGHRVLLDVLLPHGSLVRTKAGNVKRVFWALPPLLLPPAIRSLAAHHRGWGRDFRETLAREGGALLERLSELDLQALVERERHGDPEDALERIECHACPWEARPRCDAASRAIEKERSQLEHRRAALEAVRDAIWQEYRRVLEVLDAFDAVQRGVLRPKGELVASLRHDHELLVAEVVHRGVLDDATAAEVAALVSCLIEDARSAEDEPSRRLLRERPRLRRRVRQMEEAAEAIMAVQRRVGLHRPARVQTGFVAAVFRWASGDDDWARVVVQSFGGHEGDLIRAMRRLIDLLRQIAEGPEVPGGVASAAAAAARVLDRGIVLESALI
ncbi:MAG TPA: DEAD/DEAH box helicase [Methylomirabilota bacterium]|nr:DEAD/DEAH box helicase [Methylomirabilota bacterium]